MRSVYNAIIFSEFFTGRRRSDQMICFPLLYALKSLFFSCDRSKWTLNKLQKEKEKRGKERK